MQRQHFQESHIQQYRRNEVHTGQKEVKEINKTKFNNKALEPHKPHKIHVTGRRKSTKTVKKKFINSEWTTAGNTSSEEKDDQKVKIRPLLL